MTKPRKDRALVHLTASQRDGIVTLEWSVQRISDEVWGPKLQTSRRVYVKFAETLNVPQLTRVMARMVDYVLARVPGSRITPRSSEWWEDRTEVHLVPPSGGEGGEGQRYYRSDRSADTAQAEAPLPSSMPPSGAGGGGERSDLRIGPDPAPDVLPGQLELPL
jgi:hypothetical protein